MAVSYSLITPQVAASRGIGAIERYVLRRARNAGTHALMQKAKQNLAGLFSVIDQPAWPCSCPEDLQETAPDTEHTYALTAKHRVRGLLNIGEPRIVLRSLEEMRAKAEERVKKGKRNDGRRLCRIQFPTYELMDARYEPLNMLRFRGAYELDQVLRPRLEPLKALVYQTCGQDVGEVVWRNIYFPTFWYLGFVMHGNEQVAGDLGGVIRLMPRVVMLGQGSDNPRTIRLLTK